MIIPFADHCVMRAAHLISQNLGVPIGGCYQQILMASKCAQGTLSGAELRAIINY